MQVNDGVCALLVIKLVTCISNYVSHVFIDTLNLVEESCIEESCGLVEESCIEESCGLVEESCVEESCGLVEESCMAMEYVPKGLYKEVHM